MCGCRAIRRFKWRSARAARARDEVAAGLLVLTPDKHEAVFREAGFSDLRAFYTGFDFRGWVTFLTVTPFRIRASPRCVFSEAGISFRFSRSELFGQSLPMAKTKVGGRNLEHFPALRLEVDRTIFRLNRMRVAGLSYKTLWNS